VIDSDMTGKFHIVRDLILEFQHLVFVKPPQPVSGIGAMKGAKKGAGTIYSPGDGRTGCRIWSMPGPPPHREVAYDGRLVDADGDPIPVPRRGEQPGSHVPEDDFDKVPRIFK